MDGAIGIPALRSEQAQASGTVAGMGLLILTLFVVTAAQSLMSPNWRYRLANRLNGCAGFFNMLYVVFVAVFVGFGSVRALAQFVIK